MANVSAVEPAISLLAPPMRMGGIRRLAITARRKPLGSVSLALLLLVVFTSVFASVLVPYTATGTSPAHLVVPNLHHFAGTDQFGRDVLARTLAAGQVSLMVGFASAAIGGLLGLLIGAFSAYYSGWVDRVTQAIVDAMIAIPSLIMLLAVVALFSRGIVPIVAALAFRSAIQGSRTIRAAALTIQQEPYLMASETLGAHPLRIVIRHMLPNLVAPAITISTLSVAGAILAEASLSFLGYGIPPPAPTWGGMLSNEARPYLVQAPWMMIAPSIALGLTVYSINMFGDALRDIMDPRLRGR